MIKLLYYIFRFLRLIINILLAFCFIFIGCKDKARKGTLFTTEETMPGHLDLKDFQVRGEIIIGTISGPDSYYEMRGEALGTEYLLAKNYAESKGMAVRVVIAHNITELINLLKEENIDLATYPIPIKTIKSSNLQPIGSIDNQTQTAWASTKDKSDLKKSLKNWYNDNLRDIIKEKSKAYKKSFFTVTRIMRPAFISQSKGVFSIYDEQYKQAAAATGFDWRLLAAISYIESGFDPNARSGAGARGLMQLMPNTAKSMGVQDITNPSENIYGGAKYLRTLYNMFNDIRHTEERLKFAIAAYNGGIGHIRDAMALARKNKLDATQWNYVSPYIRALTNETYYNDPLVKYGFMYGNETCAYVTKVSQQYNLYGGNMHTSLNLGMPRQSTSNLNHTTIKEEKHKNTKYTTSGKIKSANDSLFNIK